MPATLKESSATPDENKKRDLMRERTEWKERFMKRH